MNTTHDMPVHPGKTIRQHLGMLPLAGALGAFVLAGCGTTEIDPKKAENDIRSSVGSAGNQLASASCPKGIKAKKNGTFTCTFTLSDNRHGTVTILMTDDSGAIHIDPSAYHLQ